MSIKALAIFILHLFPVQSRHNIELSRRAAAIISSEIERGRYDVNEKVVAALIMSESSYISDAESPKGAIGWMGVLASGPRASKYSKKQLTNPRLNVRIGLQIIEESRRSCRRIVEDEIGYVDPRLWLSRYAGFGCQESIYANRILQRVLLTDNS